MILKTHTRLDDDDEFEFLAIYAPEEYTRDINHILAAEEDLEGIEDVTLQNEDQDLALIGGTWRRMFGDDGKWINGICDRESDRVSSEGEAFPDVVPPATPADQVPVREKLLAVKEKESEFGWRSDVSFGNRLGIFSAGLHLTSNDLDYSIRSGRTGYAISTSPTIRAPRAQTTLCCNQMRSTRSIAQAKPTTPFTASSCSTGAMPICVRAFATIAMALVTRTLCRRDSASIMRFHPG